MKALRYFVGLLCDFIWHIVILLLLLVLGFHFWFIHHSESAIGELISWRSNGKIKCTFSKVSINYLSNDLNVTDIVFFNTDSISEANSYRFSAKDFHLKIHSKWDLLFHKRLVIDAVIFNTPDIIISHKAHASENKLNLKTAFPQEVGKLYKTILSSLRVLRLQLFEIKDGRLQINETGQGKDVPLEIKHINLTINAPQIDSASLKHTSRFVLSERVRLRIAGQHIELPGRPGSVGFKELLIDSKDKFIRVNSPNVRIQPITNGKSSFAFFAKKIGITGFDFNELYRRPSIEADSVFIEGLTSTYDIFGDTSQKRNSLQSPQLNTLLNKLPFSFSINHIALSKSNVTVHLHLGGKATSLSVRNDDIRISGFRLNDSKKLTIKDFNYTVRNYVGYTPDSLMRFAFDSLQFADSKIILYHLTAATNHSVATGTQQIYLVPRAEITGMDWIALAFQNKFQARSAVLYDPVLRLAKNTAPDDEPLTAKTGGKSVYRNLSLLDKALTLDQLRIINGSLSYQDSTKLKVIVHRLDLEINAKRLEKAGSNAQLMSSLNRMSFKNAEIIAGSAAVKIEQGIFNSPQMKFTFGKLKINADSGHQSISLDGISLDHPAFEQNRLTANAISWNDGDVQIKTGFDSWVNHNSRDRLPIIAVDYISAKNTRVCFENKNLNGGAFIKSISAKHVLKESGKPFELDSLQLVGHDLLLHSAAVQLKCTGFSLQDGQSSTLQNLSLQQQQPGDSLLAHIPELRFTPLIAQSLRSKKLIVDRISIEQPEIIYSTSKRATKENQKQEAKIIPDLQLTQIGMDGGSVELRINAMHSKVTDLSLRVNSLATSQNGVISVDHAQLSAGKLLFAQSPGNMIESGGHLSAGLDFFVFHPSTKIWEAQLNHFLADHIVYFKTKPDRGTVSLSADHVAISGARATNNDFKDLLPWLVDRSGMKVSIRMAKWRTIGDDLTAGDIVFSQSDRSAGIGSFRLNPRKNRDEFYKDLIYRKDYIHTRSGPIRLEGIGMTNNSLEISTMDIKNPFLSIFSNKFKKPGTDTEQPLPVAALGKIPLPLKIGKIKVNDGTIRYTELNAVSRDTGQVYFSGINALIGNLATRRTVARDSLTAVVKAAFLGKIPLRVTMDQSYKDVNGGLKLAIQLGHGKAGLLNSFLPQLVSMQARSGYVDTMFMSAEGNKYRTHGTMHLYFRDLRANLLDSGNVKRQKLSTKLTTFLFNSFALKSSNQSKGVKFYFMRDSTESTIDYFLQMIVEGAASSVIPAARRTYRKEYNKAQEAIALSSGNKH